MGTSQETVAPGLAAHTVPTPSSPRPAGAAAGGRRQAAGGRWRRALLVATGEGVEAAVRVADEGQAGLGRGVSAGCVLRLVARADLRARVLLRDLVDGKVLGVHCGGELGLEGRADLAQDAEVDAAEERVALDVAGAAAAAEALRAVRDEALRLS